MNLVMRIGFFVRHKFAMDLFDLIEGMDVVVRRWVLDEVGNTTKARRWRLFSVYDVKLVCVFFHFFWLERRSSNPTFIFAVPFMSTEGATSIRAG